MKRSGYKRVVARRQAHECLDIRAASFFVNERFLSSLWLRDKGDISKRGAYPAPINVDRCERLRYSHLLFSAVIKREFVRASEVNVTFKGEKHVETGKWADIYISFVLIKRR